MALRARTARFAVLAVLLGAVVNIALAWFVCSTRHTFWLIRHATVETCDLRSPHSASLIRTLTADHFKVQRYQHLEFDPTGASLAAHIRNPRWRQLALSNHADHPDGDIWLFDDRGFPFRCFAAATHAAAGAGVTHYGWLNPGGYFQFPTIPLWPGLFANTAVWSLPWFYLFFYHRRFRLWLRARLHERRQLRARLCPQCGYDLSGSTGCPECGRNHPGAVLPTVMPGRA